MVDGHLSLNEKSPPDNLKDLKQIPFSTSDPSAEYATVSNRNTESREKNTYLDINESSFIDDTEQKSHHMQSKIMDNSWTDQATTVALDISMRDKSSPLHNDILSFTNTPDDRLVLVPLSMLSLNSFSMTNTKSTKEPNLLSSKKCNTISQEPSEIKNIPMISDLYTNNLETQNTAKKYPNTISDDGLRKETLSNQQEGDYERKDDKVYHCGSPISRSDNLQYVKHKTNLKDKNSILLRNNIKPKRKRYKIGQKQKIDSHICQVCGEAAGRHNYYGGRSCQSCRAFFRRTVEIFAKLVIILKFIILIYRIEFG